ncbi:hypothetical protein LZ31DRAFT_4883 [Colletotrichum somersetense]|nr:hypothetical protein LZ31DRAFT_4883 [Colletotrichum somersetense]
MQLRYCYRIWLCLSCFPLRIRTAHGGGFVRIPPPLPRAWPAYIVSVTYRRTDMPRPIPLDPCPNQLPWKVTESLRRSRKQESATRECSGRARDYREGEKRREEEKRKKLS